MDLNDLINGRLKESFMDSSESKDYNRGYNNGSYDELRLIQDSLSNVEYNRKVKIPQFVAEWIKVEGITSNSFDGILNDAIFNYQFHYIGGEDIKEWILRNPMKLKNALDNDYEVEEEPKYYVETNLGYFVCFKGNSQNPFFYEGTRDLKSAAKFNDKLVSEAVAELIKGTVEEVNHGDN